MVLRGEEIATPSFGALRHSGGDELVQEVLSSLLGIPEAKTTVSERSSRTGYSVNVKHTTYYLFQKQGLVASKDLLFYRQSEEHLPRPFETRSLCCSASPKLATWRQRPVGELRSGI